MSALDDQICAALEAGPLPLSELRARFSGGVYDAVRVRLHAMRAQGRVVKTKRWTWMLSEGEKRVVAIRREAELGRDVFAWARKHGIGAYAALSGQYIHDVEAHVELDAVIAKHLEKLPCPA